MIFMVGMLRSPARSAGVLRLSGRPPANRGAAKRQCGTRQAQRKARPPGILDEKLV
jgi:hypothetical protein